MRLALAFVAVLIAISALVSAQSMFPTKQAAQAHCPSDVVVWLNIPTGIYHMQGER